MVETYQLRSLKRVHDECERALREDNYRVNQSIANRFNEVLDDFKEECPEDDRIQAISEVEGVSVGSSLHRGSERALDTIQEIKLETLKIADTLDYDTADFEEISHGDEFAVINVQQEQGQAQAQAQTQRVSVEQIFEDIDGLMMSSADRDELRELVQEFDEEVGDDDPDHGHLRDLATTAADYSDDVARKLIMLATERGVDILAGL